MGYSTQIGTLGDKKIAARGAGEVVRSDVPKSLLQSVLRNCDQGTYHDILGHTL